MKVLAYIFFLIIFAAGCTFRVTPPPAGCPADAKVCPDGSAVSRVGPKCEFAPCPTQNTTPTMTEADARVIAENTCIKGGEALANGSYNENSKTWWFDANLNATQPGCSPACVVSESTQTADINWRCTGVTPPDDTPMPTEINTFEECVAAGNPVMESYPRQCRANGKTFVETIAESIACAPEQRNADFCTKEYRPVCGRVNVQCIKAPCPPVKETFSNSCEACKNSLVESYVLGACGEALN